MNTDNVLAKFSLKNKVVLLTGGAGLYGRGLAADLASAGAHLILASRKVGALEKVVKEETALGGSVCAYLLDQSQEESVIALRDEIVKRFGRLDGLVNNAATRPMAGNNGTAPQFEESMQVNATGLFLMHRYFGDLMAQGGSGSIVNVGSIQGMVGPTFNLYKNIEMSLPPPDYFFHKGGMINLTRYYAAFLGSKNVRVNCVAPGGFEYQQPSEFVTRYSAETMLGRMAQKEDLGGAIIFLLSDASSYITGINLPVDGGYAAH